VPGVSVRVSVIKKFKSQIPNTKWFDKLTTTLSQVEGQITMTEIQNPKQLVFDLISDLVISFTIGPYYLDKNAAPLIVQLIWAVWVFQPGTLNPEPLNLECINRGS